MSNYDVTPQIDHTITNNSVPRYRLTRIPLNNLNSGTVPFLPTSQTLCEWKIPSNTAFNLSKSFITYQYTIPARAGYYTAVFENSFDFAQIFAGLGSGLGVCDLNYSSRYVKAVKHLRSKMEEDFMSGNDELHQFYKSNQPGVNNLYPVSLDGLTAGTTFASPVNNLDSQQLKFSSAPNVALTVSRSIPLSIIYDTIFSVDRDLIMGSDFYIRFFTESLQRMAYYVPNPAAPSTGVEQINAGINATNMTLYLAQEMNLDLRSMLLEALARGSIKMSIPYTSVFRYSQSTNSSNSNLSLTLTRNYGRSLSRMLYTVFNVNELGNAAQDHSNVNGTKTATFQTALNGRPLQDSVQACFNPYATVNANIFSSAPQEFAQDWRGMREWIKGSSYQNYAHYQSHWVWCDSWSVPSMVDESRKRPFYLNNDGLDLTQGDQIYSIQSACPGVNVTVNANTNSSGSIQYLFPTFLRTLTIVPDGLIISA